MAYGLLSPRFILFCSLMILAVCSKQGHAWGISSPRISVPRISVPRVSLPRVSLPRVSPPRVSLPRVSLPRVSLPRVSLPRVSLPRVSLPRISLPRLKLSRISTPRISLPRIRVGRIRLDDVCRVSPRSWLWCKPRAAPVTAPVTSRVTQSVTPTKSPQESPSVTLSNPTTAEVHKSCLMILSRSQWQAPSLQPSPALELPMYTVAVYVSGKNCDDFTQCKQQANELLTENKTYNFLIGGDGTVFEGRGWDNFSDHFHKHGQVEYGVCFMGESITDTTQLAFMSLLQCGLDSGKIYANFSEDDIIFRQLCKECLAE